MAALTWDASGTRFYETGVDKCVLYTINNSGNYTPGVAWNGVTSISESPDGAEATDMYADNIKYASMRSAEKFGASIEAYTFPQEFLACDGIATAAPGLYLSQQARTSFGLSFVTKVGDDTSSDPNAYKIHLIWGASVSPSEKSYETINDSPSAITYSWTIETNPVDVTYGGVVYKACAHMIIDSRKFTSVNDKAKLTALETQLYGSASVTPNLPLPARVLQYLATGN